MFHLRTLNIELLLSCIQHTFYFQTRLARNMFGFVTVCVLILLARMNAAYEDSYVLTDDETNAFYNEPRNPFDELSKKSPRAVFEANKRRGNSRENFMRFGRSDPELVNDYDFEYDEYEGARPTRAGINNNDRFIRFGRNKSSFLRFGRNPHKNSNFLRFGRNSDALNRRKRETDSEEEKRGGSSNFVRFGRGNGDNFMRFGRRDEKTPTMASGDSFRQSLNAEILDELIRQRLLRLRSATKAKQRNSGRLFQL